MNGEPKLIDTVHSQEVLYIKGRIKEKRGLILEGIRRGVHLELQDGEALLRCFLKCLQLCLGPHLPWDSTWRHSASPPTPPTFLLKPLPFWTLVFPSGQRVNYLIFTVSGARGYVKESVGFKHRPGHQRAMGYFLTGLAYVYGLEQVG